MAKLSAGLVMYRFFEERLEVLLVHLGGPFWAKNELGAWSIPEGEDAETEQAIDAALREFREETGIEPYVELGSAMQAGNKVVIAWGFEGDCEPSQLTSNLVRLECLQSQVVILSLRR